MAKRFTLLLPMWLVLSVALVVAQCTPGTNSCPQNVPRVLKFNGELRDAEGQPRTGTVGFLFAIYTESSGGAPLWQETQNVQVDGQGHYEVILGTNTNTGVPLEIFKSGEPRWLGAQVLSGGEPEQPRALLVSVPYALVAGDAQTLGGLPPSAFVQLAPGSIQAVGGAPSTNPSAKAAAQGIPIAAADTTVTTSGGTVDTIPKFALNSSIVNSQIKEKGGEVTLQNLANILFADQFRDGVPGAVAACPAEGCIIYAGSKNVSRNLGTIDPGNKVITIYLGPYTYTVKQITLHHGLKIIGMSASIPGTILQSINGNNPVFILPQRPHVGALDVRLSSLRIIGSKGNTSEDAFFLDASNVVETGLWYSSFDNLYIYDFAGIGMHLRGPSTNFAASNQWITFQNVVVFRAAGGGNALRIEGANFQLHFTDCEFDGQGPGDGTNIFIGGLAGGVYAFPFDITFRGLVSQTAGVGIQLDGAQTVTFHTSHHEQLFGGYLITGNSGIPTRGVTITDSVFNPNVGVNNGAGYLVKVDSPAAWGIYFTHNRMGGVPGPGLTAPDSVITAANGAQVVYQDNEYFGANSTPPTSGITPVIDASTSINIGGAHTVGINTSTTPITTIQSTLGPGETVTMVTVGGSVTFAEGGNVGLLGSGTLKITGTITFVRTDIAGGPTQWWPVAEWTAQATDGGAGNFSLTADKSAVTVNPGNQAKYNLILRASGGFSGPVQLSCETALPASNCTVSSTPITLAGSSSARASVTVATETQKANLDGQQNHRSNERMNFVVLSSVLAGMAVFTPLRLGRQRKRQLCLGVVAVLAMILCFGCGGSQAPPVPPPQRGTYMVIISGVSGNIRQAVTVTITVL